jgi:hypothetical protein
MRSTKELSDGPFKNFVKHMKGTILPVLLVMTAELNAAGVVYNCAFDPNGWHKTDWIFISRPDVKQTGGWT